MNMTPQESKDFIDSLTPEQQKKALAMLKSAMESECKMTYDRHAFRALTEET